MKMFGHHLLMKWVRSPGQLLRFISNKNQIKNYAKFLDEHLLKTESSKQSLKNLFWQHRPT